MCLPLLLGRKLFSSWLLWWGLPFTFLLVIIVVWSSPVYGLFLKLFQIQHIIWSSQPPWDINTTIFSVYWWGNEGSEKVSRTKAQTPLPAWSAAFFVWTEVSIRFPFPPTPWLTPCYHKHPVQKQGFRIGLKLKYHHESHIKLLFTNKNSRKINGTEESLKTIAWENIPEITKSLKMVYWKGTPPLV